jgi:transposase
MKSNNYIEWYGKIRAELHDKIIDNGHKLWYPSIKKYHNIDVNSCYDMQKLNNPNPKKSKLKFNDVSSKFDKNIIKCTKIFLKPSSRQKKILNLWLDACTDMYNITLKHIKSVLNFDKIVELKKLSLKVGKKGEISDKINELEKEIKHHMKEKKKLYTFITTDRQKTKQNIKLYNKNLNLYIDLKKKLGKLNFNLNYYRNKLIKQTRIYNELNKKINNIVDYQKLRTYVLKEARNKIAEKYIYEKDNNTSIKIHILDCMIKTACASFKTGITNYLQDNHKMFKIRYLSKNRSKKVMEIETQYIKEGIICKSVLGEIPMFECKSNKWIEYKLDTKKAIKLHYDSKTDTYSLFVPREEQTVESKAVENSFIGIDAGIRTFMSCISNDCAIQFGTLISDQISTLLKRIDRNNNSKDLTEKQKSDRNKKIYKRIINMVDEMHWKIINYLTNTYERIYIGKLNMKDVVNNETSNISDMSKRVGLMMKHYQFRQRLIFKCKSKRISCIEVNERYTSKTCSKCGEYKADLGSNKKYDCDSCGNLMDRDINASRCILLKNTI